MTSRRTAAYLSLTLAMMTVGSTVVASKIIGTTIPPFTATAIRFAMALPILLALMRLTKTRLAVSSRHDLLILIVQAAAGSVGYTVLLISGTRLTTATDAGVILGALPSAAALISALLLRETLSLRTIGAIVLATLGVVLVTVAPAGGQGERSWGGDALVLCAVLSESLFILLNKRLRAPIPPLALSTAMVGLGLILSLPFAAVEVADGRSATLSASSLLAVLYYALVPTIGGFYLWYSGSRRVEGKEAAVFTAVSPITAVLLSCAFLGDTLTLATGAGLGLVVAAVAMTSSIALRPSASASIRRP